MNNPKIYRCSICKNIVLKLADHSEMLTCCNQPMVLLPCNSDGAGEKHIPIITTKTKKTLTVQISSTIHPMTPEHHIE
jgi:superoxide reductase